MIASGTSITGYAGLLLGGRTILHGITNNSLEVETSITGYAGLLLGGRTILPRIANSSPTVDTSIAGYAGFLLGRRTILHGITNNSLRVNCFRNQYRQVRRVTPRWAYDFAWHNY